LIVGATRKRRYLVKKNDWHYTGLKPLKGGRSVLFLCCLSDKLFEWTKEVMKKYNEFPVGYTEWTLMAHMNIVADRCDYMPYTDYSVRLVKGKRSIPEGIVRPDLEVHNKSWQDSWMFEAKKQFISLITRTDVGNLILTRMKQNCHKLERIRNASKEMLSNNTCSTVAFTVWVDARVGNKNNKVVDRWKKRWDTPKGYDDDWEDLWKRFQTGVSAVNKQHSSFGRVYYSGYRMRYSLVKEQYRRELQQVDKGFQTEIRIPVAMLWVFAHKRWPERGHKGA
jgi:hypothetical protein